VEDPATLDKPAPALAFSKCGSETVLLVEDEPTVRELLAGFLERLGYRVLMASNGEQALRISQDFADPIDLLLTDVVMPGMGGPELSDRLSSMRSGLKVVYTSGYPQGAMTHHGMLGPEAVLLQKPFELHVLAGRLREVLTAEKNPSPPHSEDPNAQG
jgi:CheY-like chemotaxis protein